MDRKKQAALALAAFKKLYPDARCELNFRNPYQLIAATILSAQCTDARVNLVTPALFKKYPGPRQLARADLLELEGLVRSTGFYRNKAKSLVGMARLVMEKFGGEIPRTMEELLLLPGVARKTGNVVLGSAYGLAEGVVVDTHVKRLAGRIGLSDQKDPEKIEKDLMAQVPKKDWTFFGHAMTWHGRRRCFALRPDCPGCLLASFCPKRGV